MAIDSFGLRGLIVQFLDAYNDEFSKHIRQLGTYPGKAEIVERFVKEKEAILQRFVEYQNPIHYKLPLDKDKEVYIHFLEQLDAFIKRKVKRHLEEILSLITETQSRIGAHNRLSWEVDKTKVNLLVRTADDYLSGVRSFFKMYALKDLDLGTEKSPALPTTVTPVSAEKITIDSLLQSEKVTDVETAIYDGALRDMESWLTKDKTIKARNLTTLARNLGNDVILSVTNWLASPEASTNEYKSILKNGFVSLEEFRHTSGTFVSLVEKLKLALVRFGIEELKPLYDDGTSVKKRIVYSCLFRNTLMHAGLLANIRQDVPYEMAYYLYFKPAHEHHRELKLILDKTILQRVIGSDRYAPELKIIGHLLNDIKSHLDTFHESLKRYF
jgi:hypothetical protein